MMGMSGLLLVLSISIGIALGIHSYKYIAKWYYALLALLTLPYIVLHYLSTTSSHSELDEARWIYFCGTISCLLTYALKGKIEKKKINQKKKHSS